MTKRFDIPLAIVSMIALAFGGGAAAMKKPDDAAASAATFEFEHVSCKGAPGEIRVIVNHIKRSVGLITADLYLDDDETFLRSIGRASRLRVAARAPYTQFCITVPEPGNYAVAIFHDENANKKLDKGAFGIPSEPWGLSNNPKIRLRKPHVDEALFEVGEGGANVEINLNN